MTKEVNVTSTRLLNTFGEIALKFGFTSIPNSLVSFESELNITNSEFKFLLKLMQFIVPIYKQRENKKIVTEIITDKQINMRGNLSAIRKSLVKKCFIDIHKDYMNGKCFGTWYDLTGIFKSLEKLVIEKEVKINIAEEEKTDTQNYFDFYSPLEVKEKTKEETKNKKQEKNEQSKDITETKIYSASEIKETKKLEENKISVKKEIETFINIWKEFGYDFKKEYEYIIFDTLKKIKPRENEIKRVLETLIKKDYPAYLKVVYFNERISNVVKNRIRTEEKEKIKEEKKLKEKEEHERIENEERIIFEREAKERGLTSDEYFLYCEALAKRSVGFSLTDKEQQILNKVENCEVLI